MPDHPDNAWADVSTISEALGALRRDVVGPAEQMGQIARPSLGNDAGDSVIAALADMLGGLPRSLAVNSGSFAVDVTKTVARVVAADRVRR